MPVVASVGSLERAAAVVVILGINGNGCAVASAGEVALARLEVLGQVVTVCVRLGGLNNDIRVGTGDLFLDDAGLDVCLTVTLPAFNVEGNLVETAHLHAEGLPSLEVLGDADSTLCTCITANADVLRERLVSFDSVGIHRVSEYIVYTAVDSNLLSVV